MTAGADLGLVREATPEKGPVSQGGSVCAGAALFFFFFGGGGCGGSSVDCVTSQIHAVNLLQRRNKITQKHLGVTASSNCTCLKIKGGDISKEKSCTITSLALQFAYRCAAAL